MLYPEQNEARLKLSLDGTWAFALGSCVEDQFDPAKPLPDAQPIAVPASYNDQNDQTTALRRHYGWAWYQRKVTLPTFCAGQRVVLRFGSVTHTANVWLNGKLIAQHKGGFTPFEADVTALLHPGETVLLTVACDNRVNHSTLPVGNEDGQLAFFGSDNAGIPSVEAAKRAAAPQNRPNFDFFNYAGIHRPVVLYTTPKEYIEDVTVVPAVDGTVQYAVKTTGSAAVNPYKEYPLAEHHRQVLAEMIHRDKNHPCVVLWSLGNEPDLEHFPQDAYDYWHPLYELAHQLDPQNRPVTLVCCQNDYTKDITNRTMDIVCINRYYGWYNLSGDMDAACYGLNQELDFWAEQHKPVMMSEYGADTVAGLHTAGAEMFSEEFQVEFYRRLDAEFDKRPWFVGEFVWNFADYDTVQGPMRVDGNKKGLFTRDRRPKLGMHFLRQRWAEIPTFGFKE